MCICVPWCSRCSPLFSCLSPVSYPQSTNAELRNLLLLLDPESMRDGLRTAAKTKSTTVRSDSPCYCAMTLN
jgi:hypothetical protein